MHIKTSIPMNLPIEADVDFVDGMPVAADISFGRGLFFQHASFVITPAMRREFRDACIAALADAAKERSTSAFGPDIEPDEEPAYREAK